MSKEEKKQLIETIDEEGNVVNFELFDIIDYKDKEYALLLPAGKNENDEEVVLMRLTKDGEEYLFEAIEGDEEFNEVSEYIESLDDNSEEE